MKNTFLALMAFITIDSLGQSGQPPPTTSWPGGDICESIPWKLVFFDEFNGTTLNTNKWYSYSPDQYGTATQVDCRVNPDPTEHQIYLDQNVVVGGGICKLLAIRNNPTFMGVTREYSSGMINTKWDYAFQFGAMETRCKFAGGNGFWPAFWCFGGNGTEIDAAEFFGADPGSIHMGCIHWDGPTNFGMDALVSTSKGADYSSDYHTYRTEWDQNRVRYYIDGVQMGQTDRLILPGVDLSETCDFPALTYQTQRGFPYGSPNKPKIISNLAIGHGSLPYYTELEAMITGIPVADYVPTNSNEVDIDYIRLYQRTPQAGFTDLCANTVTGPFDICNSKAITYTFNGPGDISPVWTLSPNLTLLSSTAHTVTVSANSLTPANASITANYTNSGYPCPQTTASLQVRIGAAASPPITVAPPYPACLGNIVSCSVASIPETYSWSYVPVGPPATAGGLNLTPSGSNCLIEVNSVGNYQLQIWATNTCGMSAGPSKVALSASSTSPKCAMLKRSIAETEKDQNSLLVWPNPANDKIIVSLDESYTVTIFNALGEKLNTVRSRQQSEMDVSTYSSGIYFVIIETATNIYNKKIVVNHN